MGVEIAARDCTVLYILHSYIQRISEQFFFLVDESRLFFSHCIRLQYTDVNRVFFIEAKVNALALIVFDNRALNFSQYSCFVDFCTYDST